MNFFTGDLTTDISTVVSFLALAMSVLSVAILTAKTLLPVLGFGFLFVSGTILIPLVIVAGVFFLLSL